MKPFTIFSVTLGAVASVLGQTIEIGAPAQGDILCPGANFTAQIVAPGSPISCIQVGIALAIASCDSQERGCPDPSEQLGNVLYAGPWNPTPQYPGGQYQNFTLQVPSYMETGPATFTLTHLCLLGAAPTPLLEFRNVSVIVG